MDRKTAAAEIIREYPLFFMQENASQAKFIHIKNSAGKTPLRRLFEAGNKLAQG